LEFIYDLIKIMLFAWVTPMLEEELVPGIAAAQPNDKIVFRQSKGAQRIDQQRDEFGIRGRVGLTDDVRVELEVFAEPAFLLALVPEELRDGKPFHRLFVTALVGRDHPGQRRRHLRSQGDVAFALIFKVVKLADYFRTALGSEQF